MSDLAAPTLGTDDDVVPPTVDCTECGLRVAATQNADGTPPTCPDCGNALPAAGDPATPADEQFDATGGLPGAPVDGLAEVPAGEGPSVTDPSAAEGYIGDDMRSLRESAGREIVRQVEFQTVEGGDGRTIEGYAAVFDSPTMVTDQHGTYRETIHRGAFAKTINDGRKPALLFDHGQHPMVGTMPIGQITHIREDAKGLFIRGRLSDSWLVQPVVEALASGAVHGMSIRAGVIDDDWAPNMQDRVVERSVKELALRELGPVVFPAYEDTSVSVRSRRILADLADPDVRAELARAALNGTAGQAAARSTDEPPAGHSFDLIRARARAALALS